MKEKIGEAFPYNCIGNYISWLPYVNGSLSIKADCFLTRLTYSATDPAQGIVNPLANDLKKR